MILVELDSGSRKQFTSPAELAEAVGRGEVGPRARIYHQLRNQWLPITQHPEFQRRWGAGSLPLPPLERTRWTFFSVDGDEAHRLATDQLRRPGSQEESEGPGKTVAGVEESAATSRWRRALGIAMRRLRPKQED